jgi:hypothetical protein
MNGSLLALLFQETQPAGGGQNMIRIGAGVLAVILVAVVILRRKRSSKKDEDEEF